MSELFSGAVNYYRKATGIFSQIRTANYDNTFIMLDFYYPTTIQSFTPAEEQIETIYHYNRRTGQITQIQTGQVNEKTAELVLLYSDYITLKQIKGYGLPVWRQSLLKHKLIVSEKIGDMAESLIRSGMAGKLTNGNFSDVCDMDAMNIYSTLVTGVGHPVRQVDGDRYEITLTLTYQCPPIFIDASLPF